MITIQPISDYRLAAGDPDARGHEMWQNQYRTITVQCNDSTAGQATIDGQAVLWTLLHCHVQK